MSHATQPLIETRALRRTFSLARGSVEAVAGIDLTMERGTITGLLGPNGASFPLLLLSGVLLPLSLAPAWLQHLAEVNPLSHGVLASRALFNGHFDDPQIVIGAGLVAALALANVVLAARRFQRSVA